MPSRDDPEECGDEGQRGSGALIVVYAHLGVCYDGQRKHVPLAPLYRDVRLVAELDAALASHGRGYVPLLAALRAGTEHRSPRPRCAPRGGMVEHGKLPGTIGDRDPGIGVRREQANPSLTSPAGD